MKKQLLSLVIVISLIFGLLLTTGCGGKKGDGKIVVAYYMNSTIATDIDIVEEEINKLVKDKIGAEVELLPIPLGTYNDQINLMLTGSEKLDLFMMSGSRFSSYYANGQCIALDDLIASYGKDITALLGEKLISGGAINGKIYGIMPYRDVAQGVGLYIRKDYVDKYNINIDEVRTFDDVEKILKKIKDNEPSLYPLIIEKNETLTPVELMAGKDNVGDGYGVIDLYGGDPYKVFDYFESDSYREAVNIMHRWYNAGYIAPDAAINTENIATQMKAETGVCYFYKTKTGMDAQESKAAGHEVIHATLVDPVISTSQIQTVSWGIATQSTNPEAAMKFLNLMYSDKEVLNLIDWGVEGKHYVFTEDGHIRYPEGVDSTNCGYNVNMSWAFGNQFLSYVWEGNDIDIWEQASNAMKNARTAETLGFSYDSSPVSNDIAMINNVTAQYRLGLETGMSDPSLIDEFIAKLQNAGIQNVVNEKQRQLDEWRK